LSLRFHLTAVQDVFQALDLILELLVDLVHIFDLGLVTLQVHDQVFFLFRQLHSGHAQVAKLILVLLDFRGGLLKAVLNLFFLYLLVFEEIVLGLASLLKILHARIQLRRLCIVLLLKVLQLAVNCNLRVSKAILQLHHSCLVHDLHLLSLVFLLHNVSRLLQLSRFLLSLEVPNEPRDLGFLFSLALSNLVEVILVNFL
jgi:hypothetical protein